MSAQIVFLTLFLGLTSGIQPIDLHVDGAVKSVRILSGDRELARLNAPPWRARIDLGPLAPQELVAIGLDAEGHQVARASQTVNLSRPTAEFEIALDSDGKQPPRATLRWHHLMNLKPKNATLTVDGSPVKLDDEFHAVLPRLDPLVPHVVAVEMRFQDGFVARRELVIEGLRSDSVDTQLSPVLVSRRAGAPAATQFDGCFSAGGTGVRTAAVEKPAARVIIVQDPFPGEAIRQLDPLLQARQGLGTRYKSSLASDTSERILWPIAERYGDADSIATLFARSVDLPAGEGGMLWLLTRSFGDRSRLDEPRRVADAVAVAGLEATAGGFRRAVVLVLENRTDASKYTPQSVRHYLAAIGVPFFVWSLSGPRPELADTWGAVDDISTPSKLHAATNRLRAALEEQRVAWLAADPLTALHVEVKESCGLQPTR